MTVTAPGAATVGSGSGPLPTRWLVPAVVCLVLLTVVLELTSARRGELWEILPLRPMPGADDSRVKAYRKQAREGTLPPVLLWWVSGLDCHLILDGHARLAAAIAESVEPPLLQLHRTAPGDDRSARINEAVQFYENELAASPDSAPSTVPPSRTAPPPPARTSSASFTTWTPRNSRPGPGPCPAERTSGAASQARRQPAGTDPRPEKCFFLAV
ncbi:hypothetical protein PV392_06910 [Streptomyces sp. ME03-5709C]|nr:hypothetical protein [Streptomyces sp. ME03-5709C]